MSEVDEVIRALVAAGEVLIRIGQVAFGPVEPLFDRFFDRHERGQTPSDVLRSLGNVRAFRLEKRHLPEFRAAARKAGLNFSAVRSTEGRQALTVLVRAQDEKCFRALTEALGLSDRSLSETRVPKGPCEDITSCGPDSMGCSFYTCTVPEKVAGPFLAAAHESGLSFSASASRLSPLDCLDKGEMLFEAFEKRIEDAALRTQAGQIIRDIHWPQLKSAPALSFFTLSPDRYMALRDAASGIVPFAAVSMGGKICAACEKRDAAQLSALAEDAASGRLVRRSELEGRLLHQKDGPVRVLVPEGELGEAKSLLSSLGIRAHFEMAGRIAGFRENLAVRLERIASSDTRGSGVLQCTPSGRDAGPLRDALAMLEATFEEKSGPKGTTFLIRPDDARAARALLRSAGIRLVFTPPGRSAPFAGGPEL